MNEIHIKVTGDKTQIEELFKFLKHSYIVIFTSEWRENNDNEGFHRYLTIVTKKQFVEEESETQ